METSACTSVLRLAGPAGSEPLVDLLLDAFVAHFKPDDGDSNCANDENGFLSLSVANKYFTADISVRRTDSINNTSQEEKVTTTTSPELNDNNTKEDGILLAFPSNSNISIDSSLTPVHISAEENGQCGDLLRLCISVSTDDGNACRRGKAYEERYSKNVLWCLDRGYEYVEADLSEAGRLRGHDDREKDGFARIVEAMMGTVWSSAVRRKVRKQTGEGGSIGVEQLLSGEGGRSDADGDGENKDAPLAQTDQKSPKHSTNESVVENEQKIDSSHGIDNIDGSMIQGEDDEDKEDPILGNFEQVMKEAGRIREASKAGDLSDGERKKVAGDAATMLMGLLDKIGYDDSSDDEIPR